MNNLHRELAPVSAAAWAVMEEEAKRTFARHAAARKSVDVSGPDGPTLAGVGTGHSEPIDPPAAGIQATLRAWQPVVELRVPFTLSRSEIDSVERGSQDPDWQPVKDAAKQIALAEDRAVFDGYAQAKITGVGPASTNPGLTLSADACTAVSETSDHGSPNRDHLARLLDGDIIGAPAIVGALLLSGRGGD